MPALLDASQLNGTCDEPVRCKGGEDGTTMNKANHQIGLIALIKRSRPINLLTGPIIYSMIVPIMLLDLCVSFYQWTCFPIYGIPKLSRHQFIIFDRQELRYLDWVSKFHCTYCAYGVGVIAFVTQIIVATEAYFCPIKHRKNPVRQIKGKTLYLAYDEPDDFDFPAFLDNARKSQTDQT